MTRLEAEAAASAALIAAGFRGPRPMESSHGAFSEVDSIVASLVRLPDGAWRGHINAGSLNLGRSVHEDPGTALEIAARNARAELRRLSSVLS